MIGIGGLRTATGSSSDRFHALALSVGEETLGIHGKGRSPTVVAEDRAYDTVEKPLNPTSIAKVIRHALFDHETGAGGKYLCAPQHK